MNPAVRKRNGVRTIHSTAGVLELCSLEVGLGVVVRDAIREGVGLRGLLCIFHRGRGIIDNWCRSMVDNWGMSIIDSRGRSVVDNRCGMDKSMVAVADAVPVGGQLRVQRGRRATLWLHWPSQAGQRS